MYAWRYAEVTGANFGQKIAFLNGLTTGQADALARKIGCACCLNEVGSTLYIPAGYIIATVTVGGTRAQSASVLRWSVSTPARLEKEKRTAP